jgi:choline/ethanolamine kinase
MVAIETMTRIPNEARGVLREVAARWSDVADGGSPLEVRQMKGAMTNTVYEVRWSTECEVDRKVLLRVYGDGVDVFFDREEEVRTFECVSKHGQGPLLLGRFPNGRIEEFLHARVSNDSVSIFAWISEFALN